MVCPDFFNPLGVKVRHAPSVSVERVFHELTLSSPHWCGEMNFVSDYVGFSSAVELSPRVWGKRPATSLVFSKPPVWWSSKNSPKIQLTSMNLRDEKKIPRLKKPCNPTTEKN
jgi:hypothetical protein